MGMFRAWKVSVEDEEERAVRDAVKREGQTKEGGEVDEAEGGEWG